MEDLSFEQFIGKNETVDNYLSKSITNYGLLQHKGNAPVKIFCSCKNSKGKFLGAVMGTKTLDLFFISHVFVEEKFRNKNIGSELLAKIEVAAKNKGCTILRLNTFNDLSHHFYEKNGFSETIRINSYMKGFDLVFYDKKIS